MNIVEPITTSQSFIISPRASVNRLRITDKETNVTDVINVTSVVGSYYTTVTFNYSKLKEGHIYRTELYDTTLTEPIYYKGLMLATANEDDYSLNKNYYTQNTTTNEFTILE